MARRILTAEQTEARDKRRAQFRQLWKQVAAMPEAKRIEMVARLGFVKAKDGSSFSVCNMMLIAMQQPSATALAGFRDWLKLGRAVRKGEHGAMVFVPIGHRTTAENGDTVTEMDDEKRFTTGTVFDIGQTQEIETGQPVTA